MSDGRSSGSGPDARSRVRLITRGDDAAVAEGANDAIRDCFEEGILRNVSVMAPCPALDHAAERLAGVDGLCVGLHVTLTAEWDAPRWGPVLSTSDVPSLVNEDGELPGTVEAFEALDPDPDDVAAEIDAQLERLRAVGFDPDYVDVHMAVQRRVDAVAHAVTAVCEREGLIDGTDVSPIPGAGGVGTGPEWLLDALNGVEPGIYVVVGHPMYETEETRAIVGTGKERGQVATERVDQRRLFTDERVPEYFDDHGVEAIRYDEI